MAATRSTASNVIHGVAEGSPQQSATSSTDGGGYWYARDDEARSSIDLLNLLRDYRAAEKQMRIRTRESMRMGQTGLVALRFLLRERSTGRTPCRRDLAQALGLTTPATSVLVDRVPKDR